MSYNQQAIESGRADYAYRCVQQATRLSKKKEYKSQVKRMPMLIKTNGLAAAMAFANGKNEEHFKKILEHLRGWLAENRHGFWGDLQDQDLVQFLVGLDSKTYRLATVEVMGLLQWLRRFADGLIEGEAQDNA